MKSPTCVPNTEGPSMYIIHTIWVSSDCDGCVWCLMTVFYFFNYVEPLLTKRSKHSLKVWGIQVREQCRPSPPQGSMICSAVARWMSYLPYSVFLVQTGNQILQGGWRSMCLPWTWQDINLDRSSWEGKGQCEASCLDVSGISVVPCTKIRSLTEIFLL